MATKKKSKGPLTHIVEYQYSMNTVYMNMLFKWFILVEDQESSKNYSQMHHRPVKMEQTVQNSFTNLNSKLRQDEPICFNSEPQPFRSMKVCLSTRCISRLWVFHFFFMLKDSLKNNLIITNNPLLHLFRWTEFRPSINFDNWPMEGFFLLVIFSRPSKSKLWIIFHKINDNSNALNSYPHSENITTKMIRPWNLSETRGNYHLWSHFS